MARSLEYIEHHFDGPYEAWRSHAGIVYDTAPMFSPNNTGVFSGRMYINAYGSIERARYDAAAFHHTARHADASSGLISITRYPSGGPFDLVFTLPPALQPRTLLLFDHAQNYQSVHMPTEIENIYLLKTAIGLQESDLVTPRLFQPGSTYADLLNAQMDVLFAAIDASPEAPVFSERAFLRFMACVRMALRNTAPGEPTRELAREALFDLICDYIHANLGDVRLTPTDLLSRFGVSRPTLYRMFEPYGGVRAYISHQRLIGAAFELSANDTRRGAITRTAKRWGFNSSLQFNRAIRGFFGTAPSELFGAPLAPAPITRHYPYLDGYLNLRPKPDGSDSEI